MNLIRTNDDKLFIIKYTITNNQLSEEDLTKLKHTYNCEHIVRNTSNPEHKQWLFVDECPDAIIVSDQSDTQEPSQ